MRKKHLLFFTAIISIMFACASEAQAATLSRQANGLGLFGSWPFDEGTSTVARDFSGNGNTSVFVNTDTTASWVAGKRGKAVAFDGVNDYMEASTTLSSIGTGSFTSSVWFKTSASGQGWKRFVHTGCNGYSNGMFMARFFNTARLAAAVCTGGAATSYVPVTNASFLDNTWHHFVFVVDKTANTARIYVDGVNVAISKNTGSECGTLAGDSLSIDITSCTTATAAGGALRFGANSFGSEQYDGSLDEVRIYSRALSASEISSLYNAGKVTLKQTSDLGILGHWTFDEGTSTRASDFSGNNNTGTIQVTPPVWTTGARGGALSFNGTSQTVRIPHNSALKPSSAITISAWVNPAVGMLPNVKEVYRKEDTERHLLSFQTGGGCNAGMGTGGCMSFGISTGGVYAELDVAIATADWENKWSLVTATYDGVTKRLYRNGVLIGSAPASGALGTAGTNPAYIGSSSNVAEFFQGSIDDVRIYGRALSTAEILALYNQNQTTLQKTQSDQVSRGLVGYWPFNGKDVDWSSNRAMDRSPSGNNAVLAGLTSGASAVAGKAGQALRFNGFAAAEVATTSAGWGSISSLNNAMSLSVWVKRGDIGTFRNIVGALRDVSTTSYTFGFRINGVDNKVFFDIFVNGIRYQLAETTAVTVSAWNHYVFTFNGTTGSLYKNGVLQTSVSASGTIDAYVTKGFQISGPGGYSPFMGDLDEVRLYNRAISASEAKQLYLLGK